MTEDLKSLFTNTNHLEIEIKIEDYYSKYDIIYLASTSGLGCGGDLYNYEGMFTSPMYPFNDRGNSECRWNIRVPNNKKVVLYFEGKKMIKVKSIYLIFIVFYKCRKNYLQGKHFYFYTFLFF